MLNLSLIKQHLNIDSDFTADDSYLQSLAQVAETVVQSHIDHNLADLEEGGQIPAPLTQAMLLFIGNMYANRESVAYTNANEVPFAYDYLLSLFKDYSKKYEKGGIF